MGEEFRCYFSKRRGEREEGERGERRKRGEER